MIEYLMRKKVKKRKGEKKRKKERKTRQKAEATSSPVPPATAVLLPADPFPLNCTTYASKDYCNKIFQGPLRPNQPNRV